LLEKIPVGEKYYELRAMKPNPPKTHYVKKERTSAPLCIDVSIAPGKTGRISVNKGDDPTKLAANFSKAFHLNKGLEDALVKLLQQSMEAHFEKGDEINTPIA